MAFWGYKSLYSPLGTPLVKVNHDANYLGQRSFHLKVIVDTHIHTQKGRLD